MMKLLKTLLISLLIGQLSFLPIFAQVNEMPNKTVAIDFVGTVLKVETFRDHKNNKNFSLLAKYKNLYETFLSKYLFNEEEKEQINKLELMSKNYDAYLSLFSEYLDKDFFERFYAGLQNNEIPNIVNNEDLHKLIKNINNSYNANINGLTIEGQKQIEFNFLNNLLDRLLKHYLFAYWKLSKLIDYKPKLMQDLEKKYSPEIMNLYNDLSGKEIEKYLTKSNSKKHDNSKLVIKNFLPINLGYNEFRMQSHENSHEIKVLDDSKTYLMKNEFKYAFYNYGNLLKKYKNFQEEYNKTNKDTKIDLSIVANQLNESLGRLNSSLNDSLTEPFASYKVNDLEAKTQRSSIDQLKMQEDSEHQMLFNTSVLPLLETVINTYKTIPFGIPGQIYNLSKELPLKKQYNEITTNYQSYKTLNVHNNELAIQILKKYYIELSNVLSQVEYSSLLFYMDGFKVLSPIQNMLQGTKVYQYFIDGTRLENMAKFRYNVDYFNNNTVQNTVKKALDDIAINIEKIYGTYLTNLIAFQTTPNSVYFEKDRSIASNIANVTMTEIDLNRRKNTTRSSFLETININQIKHIFVNVPEVILLSMLNNNVENLQFIPMIKYFLGKIANDKEQKQLINTIVGIGLLAATIASFGTLIPGFSIMTYSVFIACGALSILGYTFQAYSNKKEIDINIQNAQNKIILDILGEAGDENSNYNNAFEFIKLAHELERTNKELQIRLALVPFEFITLGYSLAWLKLEYAAVKGTEISLKLTRLYKIFKGMNSAAYATKFSKISTVESATNKIYAYGILTGKQFQKEPISLIDDYKELVHIKRIVETAQLKEGYEVKQFMDKISDQNIAYSQTYLDAIEVGLKCDKQISIDNLAILLEKCLNSDNPKLCMQTSCSSK